VQVPPNAAHVTLAWASQEEIGFRGPHVLANTDKYDAVVAIDAFPADRRPGMIAESGRPRLGAGPVLRGADLTGVGSMSFVGGLMRLAADANIPLQPAYARGHNQASVFSLSFAVALDLPLSYLHAGCESLHRDDLQNLLALLKHICGHPRPETLWT
jgi:putative aminopeptidase FrvX